MQIAIAVSVCVLDVVTWFVLASAIPHTACKIDMLRLNMALTGSALVTVASTIALFIYYLVKKRSKLVIMNGIAMLASGWLLAGVVFATAVLGLCGWQF